MGKGVRELGTNFQTWFFPPPRFLRLFFGFSAKSTATPAGGMNGIVNARDPFADGDGGGPIKIDSTLLVRHPAPAEIDRKPYVRHRLLRTISRLLLNH